MHNRDYDICVLRCLFYYFSFLKLLHVLNRDKVLILTVQQSAVSVRLCNCVDLLFKF